MEGKGPRPVYATQDIQGASLESGSKEGAGRCTCCLNTS